MTKIEEVTLVDLFPKRLSFFLHTTVSHMRTLILMIPLKDYGREQQIMLLDLWWKNLIGQDILQSDDSFTTTTNINESSESAEINSLASTSNICGQYFPSTTTKGSTTNTIYHLLSHHNFWTASHQKKGCMGITCSWLSEDFEPIETLLNLFHVSHPHTSLIIKNLLVEEISKWGLEGKITAIATDNDSNMVSGSRLSKESLNIERISCAAHTLQFCIEKALNCDDNIKALVLRVRGLVLFFNSPKQLEALFRQQQRSNEDYP
ncbi:4819_t:CDS:2 [Entrophospora sp. SA101]|nr:4819_t:CDS:2 [Entrophospora sp. SA101]